MGRFLVLLAGLLACAPLRAQLPPELAGTWVWPVEDRSLLVLALQPGKQGETGTLQAPTQLQVSRAGTGLALSKILTPVFTAPVEYIRPAGDAHVLRFKRPDGTANDILLRADGTQGALLALGLEPGVPVAHLVRPHDPAVVPADWDPARSYLARGPHAESSVEMAEIYAADQADRQPGLSIDWSVVAPRDAQRRQRVREMLEQGLLNSGDDYYFAAMVFQHGEKPADFLLAHVLAMAAQNSGRPGSAWISTASLDRYLHSIGQPQLFGTQYRNQPDGALAQGDYDRALVPETLRPALDQPSRAEEQALLRMMESTRGESAPAPTPEAAPVE